MSAVLESDLRFHARRKTRNPRCGIAKRNREIVNRYIDGDPVSRIAHEYGLSVGQVNVVLAKYRLRGEAARAEMKDLRDLVECTDALLMVRDLVLFLDGRKSTRTSHG